MLQNYCYIQNAKSVNQFFGMKEFRLTEMCNKIKICQRK